MNVQIFVKELESNIDQAINVCDSFNTELHEALMVIKFAVQNARIAATDRWEGKRVLILKGHVRHGQRGTVISSEDNGTMLNVALDSGIGSKVPNTLVEILEDE